MYKLEDIEDMENCKTDDPRYIIQIAVGERNQVFCLDNEGQAWTLDTDMGGRKWRKLPELPRD